MGLCIYSAAFLYILLQKIFFILLESNCISLRFKMQKRIFHIRMYVVSKGRSSPSGCGGTASYFHCQDGKSCCVQKFRFRPCHSA